MLDLTNLNQNNKNISKDICDPKDITFLKYISKDSYSLWDLDNTFTIFNSINNILYLIYTKRR